MNARGKTKELSQMHLNGMQNSHQNLFILKWKTFSLYKIEMFGEVCALADVLVVPSKSRNI